ncbi:tRNA-5-taurinomethyluridine 2-sulfurtransferase [Saccharomyces paradoxus]|uniref:tRNA-5-taurinomethyluridine 2-sulfurtransferase n=1 Tax=Saccharomyces paradoxus TaxID=27291 RepID=A0A8B8UN86_SACPA|nr:Slm3 [Saccharomyces paradoxus]QHS72197.1 Slm3 [Saccharomyces paradoxus]
MKMLGRYLNLIGRRSAAPYRPQRLPAKFDNVIVAMSSGVDSSVAAALFAAEFPNTRGVYMQNWSESQSLDDPGKEPCYEKDWRDVNRVAGHLNIPVDKVNFEQDYWIDVFEPMLRGYNEGSTPNPDIGCNKFVKFGKLREWLDEKYGTGNYWLVTGHYARVMQKVDGKEFFYLLRSIYRPKDQSYYLSQINPTVLPSLLLPIGHLTKPEVRDLAKYVGLPTAEKPDSQGICFVNNSQHGKFKNFLKHYLPSSPGDIITVDPQSGTKTRWGRHDGLWSYTIGQKVGISMPQADPNYQGSWFVSEKLRDTNEIVIVRGRDNAALYRDTIRIENFASLSPKEDTINALQNTSALTLQFRSLQVPVQIRSCTLNSSGDNLDITIQLALKQRAMAPGQSCCLYIDDRVLGSGPISHVHNNDTHTPHSNEQSMSHSTIRGSD